MSLTNNIVHITWSGVWSVEHLSTGIGGFRLEHCHAPTRTVEHEAAAVGGGGLEQWDIAHQRTVFWSGVHRRGWKPSLHALLHGAWDAGFTLNDLFGFLNLTTHNTSLLSLCVCACVRVRACVFARAHTHACALPKSGAKSMDILNRLLILSSSLTPINMMETMSKPLNTDAEGPSHI